ncbi:MAG: hypothetical protein IJU50_07405 [Lachnospiraceae bacterium]|nr:hypothetical protein [Lachnospiraceae bacterium]
MAKGKSPVQQKRAQLKKDFQAQKKEYKNYLKESEKELKKKEKELAELERKQYMHSKLDPLWYLLILLLIGGVWVFIFFILTQYGVLELPNGF